MRHCRRTRIGRVLAPALVLAAGAAASPLLAQAVAGGGAPLAAQSLRPYWHVFIAFFLVWVIVFAWVISIARRLRQAAAALERAGGGSRDGPGG